MISELDVNLEFRNNFHFENEREEISKLKEKTDKCFRATSAKMPVKIMKVRRNLICNKNIELYEPWKDKP